MPEKHHKYQIIIIIIVIILAIAGLSAAGYFYYKTSKEIIKNADDLEGQVSDLANRNFSLTYALQQANQQNGVFQNQIGQIASTVGKLDQLSKTDKELLQKYSKVYFLSENYVPESLTDIQIDFLYDKTKETKMHTKAYPFLQSMISAAKVSSINLEVISAYRSFGEQSALKSDYVSVYGSGANQFSAEQGYSEHQLGTAIDFTTAQLGVNFDAFGDSDGYKWLLDNAYKYGFILSYPKGNSYYQFEPWHWRFIGRSMATILHNENENFYDADQRTIDNYLISIFD
jgi:LAS superfamily LD-carboxypeptidase LdcB